MDSRCRRFDCCRCEEYSNCGGCHKRCSSSFCLADRLIQQGGIEAFREFERKAIDLVNGLGIKGLEAQCLNLVPASYVNLEYGLENGEKVRFLRDGEVVLGQQIERKDNERCFGVVVTLSHLLVCEYGCGGSDPEILIYRKLAL